MTNKAPQIVFDIKKLDIALRNIAMDVQKNIRVKTVSGKDVDNVDFKPYSKGYAKKKQKQGLKATTVNLTLKGTMLQAIKSEKVQEGLYKVYIPDASMHERAGWHNSGEGNNPVRHFFGINQEDADKIYTNRLGHAAIVSFK
jgi:hypothetical protein